MGTPEHSFFKRLFRKKELVSTEDRVLRLATYNIRSGIGSEDGSFFGNKDVLKVKKNLQGIAEFIQDYDVDVIGLQETDFDSDKTGNFHQGQYIQELLGEIDGRPTYYLKEAMNLKREQVLKWSGIKYIKNKLTKKWPKLGFDSKLHFGTTVLSRYPIVKQKITPYTEKKPLISLIKLIFLKDLHQSLQDCVIDYGGEVPLHILNTHLDAVNKQLRDSETKMLIDYVANMQNAHYVLMGDFNEPVPHSPRLHDFKKVDPLGDNDDYRGGKTLETLLSSDYLQFPFELRQGDPTPYFTYHSLCPTRVIDYITISPKLRFVEHEEKTAYGTVQTKLSDHLPVIADIIIPGNVHLG